MDRVGVLTMSPLTQQTKSRKYHTLVMGNKNPKMQAKFLLIINVIILYFRSANLPQLICTNFNLMAAYAWVKCEREEDTDCYEVLQAANITGRRGSQFSAEDRYVRLSLIRSQDDFDILIQRLTQLVSEERQQPNHANNFLQLKKPLMSTLRRGLVY